MIRWMQTTGRLQALLLCLPFIALATIPVNVGVYQVHRRTFIAENNHAAVFYTDMPGAIAATENWQIDSIPCLWKQCLELLEQVDVGLVKQLFGTRQKQ